MKKIILVGILVLVLFVSACTVQKVVKLECNKPYIKVGTECCLDQNDNSICDKDEVKEDSKVEAAVEPPKQEKDNKIQETKP